MLGNIYYQGLTETFVTAFRNNEMCNTLLVRAHFQGEIFHQSLGTDNLSKALAKLAMILTDPTMIKEKKLVPYQPWFKIISALYP